MHRTVIIAGLALSLAACATAPSAIPASYINPDPYRASSCEQLLAERGRVDAELGRVVRSQERARTWDTAGVAITGIPVASLTGNNHRDQIGALRGQLIAIDNVRHEKSCPAPPA